MLCYIKHLDSSWFPGLLSSSHPDFGLLRLGSSSNEGVHDRSVQKGDRAFARPALWLGGALPPKSGASEAAPNLCQKEKRAAAQHEALGARWLMRAQHELGLPPHRGLPTKGFC